MLRLFNSLTGRVEDFKPLKSGHASMYTCGPTVYDFAHIGNFRTYTNADFLLRVLEYNGVEMKYIMNITDVGHLTNDQSGGADTGEDKLERSARREGKTAWEIAQFYTDAFLSDFEQLHLLEPDKFVKATDHIQEQVGLIKTLEEKGYTYQTSDGIYFDTSMYRSYGKFSDMDQIKEGARVEVNPEKKSPKDFALWKFSPADEKRQMEWKSPWGVGFPGWHIECSAMAMKYLGETIDIHTGGIDLKPIHHTNEVAQSECATGKKFVNYWFHSAFMLVTGEKMSKSLGNVYRVYDLGKSGYDPLALRYLYMQTHYRQEMNFTFPALEAAQNALDHLRGIVTALGKEGKSGSPIHEKRFQDAINDDLNMAEALSVMWDLIKSDVANTAKLRTLLKMDKVLGLNLENAHKIVGKKVVIEVPPEVEHLLKERQKLRKEKRFHLADQTRHRINKLGYDIQDTPKGVEVRKLE